MLRYLGVMSRLGGRLTLTSVLLVLVFFPFFFRRVISVYFVSIYIHHNVHHINVLTFMYMHMILVCSR